MFLTVPRLQILQHVSSSLNFIAYIFSQFVFFFNYLSSSEFLSNTVDKKYHVSMDADTKNTNIQRYRFKQFWAASKKYPIYIIW